MEYLTKDDLRSVLAEALAPYPTREEMRATFATREEMVAMFATREEMVATFATRDEVLAMFAAARDEARASYPTREDMASAIRDEGAQTRHHFDVVAESLRDDIRMLAEGQAVLHQRDDLLRTELKADIAALDRRVMRLESKRK